MKKATLIILIVFLLQNIILATEENEILISTYQGDNAIITITKSDFVENSFSLTFEISWVNTKLKPTKNTSPVLAIGNYAVKISPENSVGIQNTNTISDFSNSKFTMEFFAKPDFEGGTVEIILPFLYAENIEEAEKGNWIDVLYSKNKQAIITYDIDGEKIMDIYAPEVRLTSPKIDTNSDDKLPFVKTKSAVIHISAYDKSGVKSVFINSRQARKNYAGEYTKKVTLYTGTNIIKVRAIDNFGNQSTTEFEILCSFQYDINLKDGNYYALFVGINDYEDDGIPDLDKPIGDAESLKNILTETYTFDEENVYFLQNATRSDFIKKLDELAEDLDKNDNLLTFD